MGINSDATKAEQSRKAERLYRWKFFGTIAAICTGFSALAYSQKSTEEIENLKYASDTLVTAAANLQNSAPASNKSREYVVWTIRNIGEEIGRSSSIAGNDIFFLMRIAAKAMDVAGLHSGALDAQIQRDDTNVLCAAAVKKTIRVDPNFGVTWFSTYGNDFRIRLPSECETKLNADPERGLFLRREGGGASAFSSVSVLEYR